MAAPTDDYDPGIMQALGRAVALIILLVVLVVLGCGGFIVYTTGGPTGQPEPYPYLTPLVTSTP